MGKRPSGAIYGPPRGQAGDSAPTTAQPTRRRPTGRFGPACTAIPPRRPNDSRAASFDSFAPPLVFSGVRGVRGVAALGPSWDRRARCAGASGESKVCTFPIWCGGERYGSARKWQDHIAALTLVYRFQLLLRLSPPVPCFAFPVPVPCMAVYSNFFFFYPIF